MILLEMSENGLMIGMTKDITITVLKIIRKGLQREMDIKCYEGAVLEIQNQNRCK